MMYLPTTVVLMLPEMKMTGSATPNATRDTRFGAERMAGLSTSAPTKEYTIAPVSVYMKISINPSAQMDLT